MHLSFILQTCSPRCVHGNGISMEFEPYHAKNYNFDVRQGAPLG